MQESKVFNIDCIKGMKEYPDKYFDLAMVDPPYAFSGNTTRKETKLNKGNKFAILYSGKNWNETTPTEEYFFELFRVSKNQIVCGGNYFTNFLPVSRGWVLWDKMGDNLSVVNDELIWTSFDIQIKKMIRCHGLDKGFMNKEGANIHPTQKPIYLYKWLLKTYAEPGQRILDTHLGSGSSRIAADELGFDFTGFELDEEYYNKQEKRFKQYKSQLRIEGW